MKRCCGIQASSSNPSSQNLPPALKKNLSDKSAVTWVASDVFDRTLTLEEVIDQLSKINVESALLSMAMLNAVCSEFSVGRRLKLPEGLQKLSALADYLFAAEDRSKALGVFTSNLDSPFVPLAPQACVALTEACLRFCNRSEGIKFEQPNQLPIFSVILLSFQEHLMPITVTKGVNFGNLTEEQFRWFVRNYQANNLVAEFAAHIRRHYLMFCVGASEGALKSRKGVKAPDWFTQATGIDPNHFGFLMIISHSHGHEFSIEAPDLRHLFYDLDKALKNILPEVADSYRRLHALSVVEQPLPPPGDESWGNLIYGSHYVRRKPIVRLQGEQYLCLFKQLLTEKLFAGLIHLLTELVKAHTPPSWPEREGDRIDKLRREMGYVFEDYVRNLLLTVFDEDEVKTDFNFRREDGGECDALIVIGQTAVAFELVHHPWNLKERAEGHASSYIPHLKDNITKVGKLGHELAEAGIALNSSIERIIPIVVTSEVCPINQLTCSTWQKKLIASTEGRCVLGSGSVFPLQTLSIAQLENLDRVKGLESGASIVDFLAKRAQNEFRRFDGDGDMGCMLEQPRKLAKFDQESQAVFKQLGPTLFKPQETG